MNKPITLQVDSEVADALNRASTHQQQAIQSVVNVWLRQMVQPESLKRSPKRAAKKLLLKD